MATIRRIQLPNPLVSLAPGETVKDKNIKNFDFNNSHLVGSDLRDCDLSGMYILMV